MNLFIRNSQYYHLLKYVLFLLKHPVYTCFIRNTYIRCSYLKMAADRRKMLDGRLYNSYIYFVCANSWILIRSIL